METIRTLDTIAPDGLMKESEVSLHRLDVNSEAALFTCRDGGSTEEEYLSLLATLVGIFKPTHLLETGTFHGWGTLSLIQGASPGAEIWTVDKDRPAEDVFDRIQEQADTHGVRCYFVSDDIFEFMGSQKSGSLTHVAAGKVTFAFLDTYIPIRASEFEYLSDPANALLDFSRPICVCIHDMSRYRHPLDADSDRLADAVRRIRQVSRKRGWQALRLHQSRGMYVLVHYPDNHVGIDGECIVPESLLSEADTQEYMSGTDPYLITDYYPNLREIAQNTRAQTICEIGVRFGYSLAVMLDACSSQVQRVIAIDDSACETWGATAGAFATAQRQLANLHSGGRWPKLEAISFLDVDTQSLDVLPSLDGAFIDLAYIDGDRSHAGCLHDLELVFPNMAPDGTMIVDDADFAGLRDVVESWASSKGCRFSYHADSSGRGRVVIFRQQ